MPAFWGSCVVYDSLSTLPDYSQTLLHVLNNSRLFHITTCACSASRTANLSCFIRYQEIKIAPSQANQLSLEEKKTPLSDHCADLPGQIFQQIPFYYPSLLHHRNLPSPPMQNYLRVSVTPVTPLFSATRQHLTCSVIER